MNVLFQEPLRRELLLALPPVQAERTLAVAVHRNHSFELVASVLNAFLGLSRVQADFLYSEYDDSLNAAVLPNKVDMHLVWLDATRYTTPNFPAWLASRITALKEACPAPVLVACCGLPAANAGAPLPALPDVLYMECDALLAPLGEKAFDARLEPFTGTRLSNAACLALARELGTHCIPALLFPPLKALVLDLDNTLHAGVLGEDGIQGVQPHIALQTFVAELARKGFLLALASKNEEEDVKALFAARKDYPLRWEDFAVHRVNWQPKADNIQSIATAMNIGLDAMLFVDDNPGERLHVARTLPAVRVLAADSPEETLAGLRYYPGLRKTTVLAEDALRSADIQANAQRSRMQQSLSAEEYLRELGITLHLEANPAHHAARIGELLHKTNQFILAYARPSQAAVAASLAGGQCCAITASMKDTLSDSGLIAVLLARKADNALCLDEVVVSCRALGRGIEDGMLKHMLALAGERLHAGPAVHILYRTGPRNAPGLAWLQALAPAPLQEQGTVVLPALPAAALPGVTVQVETSII
ncbi:HAD-IIIC family phosphatase [Desulfovibrio cuneatus]|uniref:HAD-IIIC family phosphatase n=1 Tax=Desulfovibrio cuneatus TaxID=159728 RepID=UPI000402046A|nr:HAD-IIIC family phosphatase [Desulfovibrio cuneatus]